MSEENRPEPPQVSPDAGSPPANPAPLPLLGTQPTPPNAGPEADDDEGSSGPGVEKPRDRSPASASLPNVGNPISPEPEKALPFGPTTGIGSPIPIPKKQAEWESGFQNEHGPRPSRWEAWVEAPFQEGAHNTTLSPWGGAFNRLLEEDRQGQGGDILPPDEANRLYPGRPIPYTTPVNSRLASMEYADRQKQQALNDWIAQRPSTIGGQVVSFASGFVGGMTDPLNLAIGVLSGGVSELLAPEAAGVAGKLATHYLSNLGGFSAAEALQNLTEHRMGAKQKQMGEIVKDNLVPAALMTGVGIGLSALARRFVNEGGGTAEVDHASLKKVVAALEQDKVVPELTDQRQALLERKSGVHLPEGLPSERTVAAPLNAPLHELPLYAAVHADGTPLVHEHGLGGGVQLTDSHEVANNGVSRSMETPGHLAETRLPEGAKLLNLDRPAVEDYHSPDSFLKKVEAAFGISLQDSLQSGESIKDIITQIGDLSGVAKIPEDALQTIQALAKAEGFTGYQFSGPGSRQVNLFDATGLQVSKSYMADPKTTPPLPEPQDARAEMEGAQPAQTQNPALDQAQSKFYSPEIEKLAHEFRKGKTFDPYSPEVIAETQKDIENYKEQLSAMAKESGTAAEAFEELRKQEAQDTRLRDIARRIAECGQGGGT